MNRSEQALAEVCVEVMIEQYGDLSVYEELPGHTFSPGFEAKIKKLRRHIRGNRYHRLTRVAKVALIAALLALLFGLSAVAAKQYGFSLKRFWNHSELDIDAYHGKLTGELVCEYIPEGFEETEEYYGREMIQKTYKYNDDPSVILLVSVYADYYGFSIDTESREAREVTVNGITYTIAGSEEDPIIIWMYPDSPYLYCVIGDLSEDTLFEIALHTFVFTTQKKGGEKR